MFELSLSLSLCVCVFFGIPSLHLGHRRLPIWRPLGMAACHFFVCKGLTSGTYVEGGVDGNLNVLLQVTESITHTVIHSHTS